MDEAGAERRAPGRGRSRRLGVLMIALVALGLLQQALILAEALAENPFARVPVNDAATYWAWAGEIARGRLVARSPFLSAPLYPYVVGLLRALGGTLFELYALQIALHLATAALLVRVALLRFGLGARAALLGLCAGALWLALREPAFATSRVLGSSLQAFLAVLLWERMLAPSGERPLGAALVGLVLGLFVLVQPPMLLAVPLVVFWAWRGPGGARAGVACALAAALAIAPATLHNRLASGETILVSAQSGVTFAHGNAPGADGTYTPIPGVSSDRLRQNFDARALAAEFTDGSWSATSRYFMGRGLAFWRERPGEALALALRKLRWFVSGRRYGDVYVPDLEREVGVADRLDLAPVRTPWIVLPALVALAFAGGTWRRRLPELALALVPLAVVVVFWYSPRYRFPALPVLALFAVVAAERVLAWRQAPRVALACAAAWALALASGALNGATGFDGLTNLRAQHERQLGRVLVEEARYDEAKEALRRALELGDLDAHVALADVLRRLGQLEEAHAELRAAVDDRPDDLFARRSLAVVAAERAARVARSDPEAALALRAEAQREFEAALALDPRDFESLMGLGNVLLSGGDADGALARYREAIELVDCYATAWFNVGLAEESRGERAAARAAFRSAIACDPAMVNARLELVQDARDRGAWGEAVELLRAGHALAPEDAGLANQLAYFLATSPDEGARDGAEALALARRIVAWTRESDPWAYDVLGLAQAEQGDLAGATESAERALAILRAMRAPEADLAMVEGHLAAFREGRPWRQ